VGTTEGTSSSVAAPAKAGRAGQLWFFSGGGRAEKGGLFFFLPLSTVAEAATQEAGGDSPKGKEDLSFFPQPLPPAGSRKK